MSYSSEEGVQGQLHHRLGQEVLGSVILTAIPLNMYTKVSEYIGI